MPRTKVLRNKYPCMICMEVSFPRPKSYTAHMLTHVTPKPKGTAPEPKITRTVCSLCAMSKDRGHRHELKKDQHKCSSLPGYEAIPYTHTLSDIKVALWRIAKIKPAFVDEVRKEIRLAKKNKERLKAEKAAAALALAKDKSERRRKAADKRK